MVQHAGVKLQQLLWTTKTATLGTTDGRRGVQGRPLLARLGRRTVLILDVPYVHQLLEAYVSKLFALSYGVASVDVHGTDPSDHFVHCFTHRYATARGMTTCAFV